MVPRFQINKSPSPLITNEDNTIEVIINEVYDNDKDERVLNMNLGSRLKRSKIKVIPYVCTQLRGI